MSGKHPLRPRLGPEYALAVIWAEAALEVAETEAEVRVYCTVLYCAVL